MLASISVYGRSDANGIVCVWDCIDSIQSVYTIDPQSPVSCALADENDEQLFDYFSGLISDLKFDFWGSFP